MSLIRLLRSTAGVTQQELATRGGTSQPTIAWYESGAKSPTIKTVQKLARAMGLELVATFVSPMTREERRSLRYHEAIAQLLRRDSAPVIARARRNLARMRQVHPDVKPLFDRWSAWVQLPTDTLILHLLDPQPEACEMRHNSPFAGVLTPQERTRILQQFRKECAA